MADPSSDNGDPASRAKDSVTSGKEGSTGKARTLPPPEWTRAHAPRSAASVALDAWQGDAPVSRKMGAIAEQAWLRARIRACRDAGDDVGERDASAALARSLAARGAELDLAAKLARRALSLGYDDALREELAGWYAGLGEPVLAAAILRPLVHRAASADAGGARILIRIAVLLGRAGDAVGAVDALDEAARVNPADPIPPELLGAVGAWSPDAVPACRSAEAYLEGCRRHEAADEKASAFEDLLRAVDMAPQSPVAVEKLAGALAARGRTGAGDEVLRLHAEAAPDRAVAVHRRRMVDAATEGDLPRALGAGLDGRLDASLDLADALRAVGRSTDDGGTDPALGFDDVLLRAGLHELLAARLDLAARALADEERSACSLALGRLYAGPLASAERGVSDLVEALVADPTSEEAKASLREYAAVARDDAPLVEALVRSGGDADCLRELVTLAERRLADPVLALWAVRRLREAGHDDSDLREIEERLRPQAEARTAELRELERDLASARGDERLELLRRKVEHLRGRPDAADALVATLLELVERAPQETRWRLALERLLARLGRHEELVALLRHVIERGAAPGDDERARLSLAAVRREQGDLAGALRELQPLFSVPAAHRAAASMALLLATRLGDDAGRAEALERLASPLAAPYRAVVLACAADVWLRSGVTDRARSAAQSACHADPSSARSVAALAAASLERRDRVGAAALERAMGVVVPRAAYCEALARTQEDLGEDALALAWTQRWLALRPGDPRAAAALLARVSGAGDAARLGDALAWLLTQPQPLGELAHPLCEAVRRLAEIDATRGAAIARRALDVFGPRVPELRNTVLTVAELVGERGLAIATVERWLAAGAQGADRVELLLDVARRRKRAGDADGAARALARALAEGGAPGDVLAELDVALPARTSDGEISMLECRAEALSATSTADVAGTIRAWRELGAARWDLAGDHAGAIEAWERAAALDPERGIERLAGDLVAFADSATALTRLTDMAERREDPKDGARVLSVAAHVAYGSGQPSEALEIAIRALELDPSLADVLAVAERAATDDDVDMLARAYDVIANAALGVYGERAAHYRAARQFEKRGAVERALRHATRAFEAVPAEGVTFVLMMRLGQRLGNSTEVVQAIERVAGAATTEAARAAWLRRAAMVAGDTVEGARQRIDVLLRALTIRADAETMGALGDAMALLVARVPDETDITAMRFKRALEALLPRLEGIDGARAAVEGAVVSLRVFRSPPDAFDALARALECDASVDEYDEVDGGAFLELLAADSARAQAFVLRAAELGDDKLGNVGPALLRLSASLARRLGERSALARLLVQAAHRNPEDTRLLAEAEEVVRSVDDVQLLGRLLEAVPVSQRVAGLREVAVRAEREGDWSRAVASLKEAADADGIALSDRVQVFEELRDLYGRTGRRDDLEALLTGELARSDIDEARCIRISRDLAALVAGRGDVERSLEILRGAAELYPAQAGLFRDMVTYAGQAQNPVRHAEALGRLVDLTTDAAARLDLLRELAPLLEEVGDAAAATARWSAVLELAPDDVRAMAALERDAEAAGDYERVVALLARRASHAVMVEEVRRLRLRRASVLDRRLGRPDEARAELEAVLAATGDHREVLCAAADVNQRMSAPLRAAPLWFRASGMTTDRSEAAVLAQRSVEAYLAGGDANSARRVLEGMEAWAGSDRLLELRVEVERRGEDPRALGDALEDLALASMGTPSERAALLVESARAADRVGDLDQALARAHRAANIAPRDVEPQLVAKLFEYRKNGFGSAQAARVAVAELRGARGDLDARRSSLRSFLIAEALDVAVGQGAGMKELTRAHADCGPLPLIAVGMAERLARERASEEALTLFDAALAGDLMGVRSPGGVALLAARTARQLGDSDRALRYLETAATDAATRGEAVALQAEIRAERAGSPEQSDEAPRTQPLPEQPDRPPAPVSSPTTQRLGTPSPEPAARRSSTPPPRRRARTRGRAGTLVFPPASDREARLLEAVEQGSVEAGKELIQQLENRKDRTYDLVLICRAVAAMLPGDPWVVGRLYEAALADQDIVYARAIEHVLHALDPGQPPVPPPDLSAQRTQPERVRALLFQDAGGAAQEALQMVWQGADHVFRRDPGTYGVTGLERVPLGSATPLARTYTEAVRLLGLRLTPLFQRRSAGAITVSVALLSPPAIILSGDVRQVTPELRYHLGAMLSATLPEHALLFGLPESQARAMLKGLLAAFGPPQPDRTELASIATLAEVLWETMPARSQRRLRELCDDPEDMTYEVALAAGRRAVGRAGLFVSGDLEVAIRQVRVGEGIPESAPTGPNALADLCAASPAIGDLVVLATGPEYADARWQPERERRSPSGTRAV